MVPASKSFTNLSGDQLSVNFAVPSLSVNNVTVTEGNTGESTATFTVTLKPASAQTVAVKYQTANSTALAPGDYTALPLTTLTFSTGHGQTSWLRQTVRPPAPEGLRSRRIMLGQSPRPVLFSMTVSITVFRRGRI
jgi:hypothetical protein